MTRSRANPTAYLSDESEKKSSGKPYVDLEHAKFKYLPTMKGGHWTVIAKLQAAEYTPSKSGVGKGKPTGKQKSLVFNYRLDGSKWTEVEPPKWEDVDAGDSGGREKIESSGASLLRARNKSYTENVKDKIQNDLKAAMKSGEKLRMMALRGVLSEISRLEKDVRRDPNDAEILQIIKRERAKREESLEFARKAARQDLIEQNETEAKILDSYLPAAASADEVRAEIAAAIAAGASQMGPS